MVLMVQETEALADADLPVAQLAAQMRLAEGYAEVPGQDDRLRLRLRAAIGTLERRLGKVLIAREVVLSGPSTGKAELTLPIAPVTAVTAAEEVRRGIITALDGAVVEEHPQSLCVVLPRNVPEGATVRLMVTAGWGTWDDIPEALAQAVLLTAEALDAGDSVVISPMVESLIAPWRVRRIGGAG